MKRFHNQWKLQSGHENDNSFRRWTNTNRPKHEFRQLPYSHCKCIWILCKKCVQNRKWVFNILHISLNNLQIALGFPNRVKCKVRSSKSRYAVKSILWFPNWPRPTAILYSTVAMNTTQLGYWQQQLEYTCNTCGRSEGVMHWNNNFAVKNWVFDRYIYNTKGLN